jgi:hypothetical protein
VIQLADYLSITSYKMTPSRCVETLSQANCRPVCRKHFPFGRLPVKRKRSQRYTSMHARHGVEKLEPGFALNIAINIASLSE